MAKAETKQPHERAIDIPLESLPQIDEHEVRIASSPEAIWSALLTTVRRSFGRAGSARLARILGSVEQEAQGPPNRIGSTLPGFVVARVVEPAVLALEGQHRFSRYGLVFSIEPTMGGWTRLRAETRAEFPGAAGTAYRTLVIGTRGHVVVVRSILRAVRRRAEAEHSRLEGPSGANSD